MNKVLQFPEKSAPYMEGPARCIACAHECVVVLPVGVTWVECPACHLHKLGAKFPVLREGENWRCKCGCDVFYVHRVHGCYCPQCGNTQRPFD